MGVPSVLSAPAVLREPINLEWRFGRSLRVLPLMNSWTWSSAKNFKTLPGNRSSPAHDLPSGGRRIPATAHAAAPSNAGLFAISPPVRRTAKFAHSSEAPARECSAARPAGVSLSRKPGRWEWIVADCPDHKGSDRNRCSDHRLRHFRERPPEAFRHFGRADRGQCDSSRGISMIHDVEHGGRRPCNESAAMWPSELENGGHPDGPNPISATDVRANPWCRVKEVHS
jgi:hypothetical protein